MTILSVCICKYCNEITHLDDTVDVYIDNAVALGPSPMRFCTLCVDELVEDGSLQPKDEDGTHYTCLKPIEVWTSVQVPLIWPSGAEAAEGLAGPDGSGEAAEGLAGPTEAAPEATTAAADAAGSCGSAEAPHQDKRIKVEGTEGTEGTAATCEGCNSSTFQPNQLAHMGPGGCLSAGTADGVNDASQ